MSKTVDNGSLSDYDVATGAGVVDADTQRVTLASDDPAVVALQALDNAIAGSELQVDVVTMPTVAVTDNAGSLTVDDGGGSLTVDGTVAVSGTVAVTDNSGSLTVDNAGTFAVQAAQSGTWNITNVSGTVSLPTGAATAAKQPALGTAGTPSADVITVQGVTSMTPLKVDGSAVTQPVSDAGGSLTVDGTVTVQDGGGSLTVDGTVAATQSGPWTVDLGATDNAVLDAIAASLAGTLTVTGGGGGTEYTEGDTDASITGSAIMWEDTGDTLRAVSAAKPLPVGDGGGSLTVDAASLPLPTGASTAANQTTMIGHLDGVEGLLTTIDADTGTLAGAVSGTEMQVDVVASLPAGTNAIGKLAANSGVDIGDVDVTSVIPGTGATNLGKAEDAAHSSGDVGVMALAVRKDTATQLAGTDGDYSPLITDSSGALHVTVASGSVTATGTVNPDPITPGTRVSLIDVDETEDEIKATAGTLYSLVVTNLATSTRYVRLYNATAASTTVGSTTPWRGPYAIPAGAGMVYVFERGLTFGTALCIAATTGVADSDTGAPGANEVVAEVVYA